MTSRHARWLVWILCLLPCCFAAGQQKKKRQPPRENVRCVGKIKGMARGILHVEGEGGEQWLVAIEARPQDISFRGTAVPDFLRPGMLIQFSTSLDRKRVAQKPISEVRVVSPRPGVELGLRSEGGLEGKELFASDDQAGTKGKEKPEEGRPVFVSGTIRALKNNQLIVATRDAAVRAEIADNCSVAVDVWDYGLARLGDSAEIMGWRYVGQPTQIHATNVRIEAELPLEAAVDGRQKRGQRRDDKKQPGAAAEPDTDRPAAGKPQPDKSEPDQTEAGKTGANGSEAG